MRTSRYHPCKPRMERPAVKLRRSGLAAMLKPILRAFSFPFSGPVVGRGKERVWARAAPAPGAAPSNARGSPGLN